MVVVRMDQLLAVVVRMDQVVAIEVAGLHVPDAGPVFFAALAVHVLAGGAAVVSGALAATAAKRPGRHPRAGTVYLYAISAVFGTATVLAALRWRQDWHLFVIACVASGLAWFGWSARRPPRGRGAGRPGGAG